MVPHQTLVQPPEFSGLVPKDGVLKLILCVLSLYMFFCLFLLVLFYAVLCELRLVC